MKRKLTELAQQHFDIIVVGAGVYGACVARDAALRGLSVALIDKGDIGGETSHNSLKIIHGGIRYLQHLNIKRTWESIKEQKYWLRIAPHLVKPIQCIMPTYGHGLRGPAAMWLGIKVYETLGVGRNRSIPAHRQIPKGKVISREACLALIPGINSTNLTGAAIWYDAQVFAADEAVIETAASAEIHGAQVANYVSAEELLFDNQKVVGIRAKDILSDKTFDVSSSLVVNATGPWAKQFLSTLKTYSDGEFDLPLTKSMNIVTRPLFGNFAVAIQSKRQSDSVVGTTKRLYFFTPWEDNTVTGTTHFPYDGNPDSLGITKQEVQQFITEINDVYPRAKLAMEDVIYCYRGLTPADEPLVDHSSQQEVIRSHHSKIIDHADDGTEGLISIVGVKYTTSRLIAEKCVNRVCSILGKPKKNCLTRTTALENSDKEYIKVDSLDDKAFRKYCLDKIENTMAVQLTDLVLRRMNLAMRGKLTPEKFDICLQCMSRHFGWDSELQHRELDRLNKTWLDHDLTQHITQLMNSLKV